MNKTVLVIGTSMIVGGISLATYCGMKLKKMQTRKSGRDVIDVEFEVIA